MRLPMSMHILRPGTPKPDHTPKNTFEACKDRAAHNIECWERLPVTSDVNAGSRETPKYLPRLKLSQKKKKIN